MYRNICSWRPEPSSSDCGSIDQQCCGRITDTNIVDFFPENHDLGLLACQEYVSRDDWDAANGEVGNDATPCNRFYGWNGTHPQEYALELLQCQGGVPADPTCSTQRTFGRIVADDATSIPTASDVPWAMFVMGAGIGSILVGAALRFRRHRLQSTKNCSDTPGREAGRSRARRKNKHQFVDWMQKTVADIPVSPVRSDGFMDKPRSKRHRDFMRLYEKLEDRPVTPEKLTLLG